MAISVSPIYYVTFTSAILVASFILYQGFNVTDDIKTVSLLGGFLTVFSGVYLLNFDDGDPEISESYSDYELASDILTPRASVSSV